MSKLVGFDACYILRSSSGDCGCTFSASVDVVSLEVSMKLLVCTQSRFLEVALKPKDLLFIISMDVVFLEIALNFLNGMYFNGSVHVVFLEIALNFFNGMNFNG